MHTIVRSTVDRSLARGLAWTSGVKWMTSIGTWGLTLVTARILTPSDYGLMGMAMVWIGLAQVVSEVGISATLVQAPSLSEGLASRLGGAALMVAVAVAAVTVGSASLAALFFREPTVGLLVTVLSVSFLLRGAQILRRALLVRSLQFKRLALIEGAEALIAASVTLVAASMGAHYWSLVLGILAGSASTTLILVLSAPHPLRFPKHPEELEGTIRFGAHVLTGQLAWYMYSTADMIIVGRLLGSAALGAYTLAWVLASLALDRIASLLGRVTPAIISAVQKQPALLRRYVYAITEGLALVTLPVCIGIALTADLIVPVVLGPTWAAAVEPMQLLALYAAVRCLAVVLPQILIYSGRAQQSTKYNLITLGILVPLFILGASVMGTTGVAWVWVLVYPMVVILTYLRDLRREIGLTVSGYLGSLWPAISATSVMMVVVFVTRMLWETAVPTLPTLIGVSGAGALAYISVVALLHRARVLSVLKLLRDSTPPASAPPAGSRGRLLLICYHFPPDPAIGSLRWQKFAKIAAARGWLLDVIMRDEAGIAKPDLERMRDLPAGTRRIGVPDVPLWHQQFEDRMVARLRRFIPPAATSGSVNVEHVGRPTSRRDLVRMYHAINEHLVQRRWARDAADAAIGVFDPDVHRAVIACGPPYSACVAGRLAAAATELPLVLDFRDPWSLSQRLSESTASPVSIALGRREESLAVRAAEMIVVNSAPVGDAMRARYQTSHIIDVPNGFDDEPLPTNVTRERFVIAYAGTIYLDRDSRTLFEALASVVNARGLTPSQIGIEFMGAVEEIDGTTLQQRAQSAGVEQFVGVTPPRPRSEALTFLAGASLLTMLPQDADLAIPGKIYEYMRFDAWMLVLAEPESATARLLEGSSAHVVSGKDVAAIASVIDECYMRFCAGERGSPVAVDERFSRVARGKQFFDALEDLLVPAPVPLREPYVQPPAMQPAP